MIPKSFYPSSPVYRVSLCVAFFIIILMALGFLFGVRFTWTASLPPGLYRAVDEPVQRGALVSVCLPKPLAITTRRRGYGHPGLCPGWIAPLLKRVAAVPGDTVRVEATEMRVNGLPIPHTQRLASDSEGLDIPMIEEGIYTVKDKELWLVSNYRPRSWDSRYFGPIPVDRVQSVMKPMLTWKKQ